ncbi:EcsC family protein [Faucicola atlantae]|uniref:EcsC protein family n=1 Tax=Faucicola atlantae TaxID=34059 RepID=A0A1B8QDW7_9GAMM|nr:EcsC family protein [Moraxella atlantae]OBX79828.1 hypothetical protein A9306_08315 [Moraxella atlantae]
MANLTHTIFGKTRDGLNALGGRLATFTDSSDLPKDMLQDLDLTTLRDDIRAHKNAFHDQIPALSAKLMGKTPLSRYQKYADRFVPQSLFDKASDSVFMRVGKLAQSWADTDLHNNPQFGKQLSTAERDALAEEIANQNRALATLGSVSNFAGLLGILGDTFWLLAVCLRHIFQISYVYDRPLTGSTGVVLAYEILSKVNLKKLQEKQTLLAGLGLFEAMTDDTLAENQDLLDNSTIAQLFSAFDEIAENINLNLERFNVGILHKVLPITAVGIGTAYNNQIIHEVITVTQAVFADHTAKQDQPDQLTHKQPAHPSA